MSTYDDVDMDFGDDDDADDFLTGKLAALGIDEDLELSGGEEEDDSPAPATTLPAADTSNKPPDVAAASSPQQAPSSTTAAVPAATSGSKTPAPAADDWGAPPSEACSSGDAGIWGEVDSWGEARKAASPAAAGGKRGRAAEVEDGELVQMIDQPLRTSRGSREQRSARDRGRGGGGRRGGGGGGRGKGGRPKHDGKAQGRNVTLKECANWVCDRLDEPKYYLMCRVVSTIGYTKTRDLLEAVHETQETGGMLTADGSRKRTAGGVFFTLLKKHMEPALLKELYADEIRVKKETDRAKRAINKRKAEAALAGDDVMTPRNPPRTRGRSGRGGRGGGAMRAGRDMGKWAGPTAGAGGSDGFAHAVAAKRARASVSSLSKD
ncbi:unnamed protein product [Ectocarpus fasciculatus]